MLIPITIFIPTFKKDISFLNGSIKFRKINQDELKNFFGVDEIIFENQKPKQVKPAKRGFSYYDYLFPSGLQIHEATGFIHYPYFVIEVESQEIADILLFSLRLFKREHFLAPFGFGLNTIYFFQPMYTIDRLRGFNYELHDSDISNLDRLLKNIIIIKDDEKFKIIKSRYLHALYPFLDKKVKYIELVSVIESIILNNKLDDKVCNRFKKQLNLNIEKITKTIATEIYNIRSNLTHVGFYKKSIDDNNKKYSIHGVHEYTQEIIRKYIEGKIINELI